MAESVPQMIAKTPTVSAGGLYDPASPGRIDLDSPAWWAWLERPTTTRFAYPLVDPAGGYIIGFMTIRKEGRQRGGQYWTAYRRAGARLRKVYLGRSATVTQARLQAIADQLREERRRPA
jgi:LuxR family maltose regulon positive regulatory protein